MRLQLRAVRGPVVDLDALQSQGLNTLGIPWTPIVAMLIASVVVGILGAALPAMKAVRLNILDAMAHA